MAGQTQLQPSIKVPGSEDPNRFAASLGQEIALPTATIPNPSVEDIGADIKKHGKDFFNSLDPIKPSTVRAEKSMVHNAYKLSEGVGKLLADYIIEATTPHEGPVYDDDGNKLELNGHALGVTFKNLQDREFSKIENKPEDSYMKTAHKGVLAIGRCSDVALGKYLDQLSVIVGKAAACVFGMKFTGVDSPKNPRLIRLISNVSATAAQFTARVVISLAAYLFRFISAVVFGAAFLLSTSAGVLDLTRASKNYIAGLYDEMEPVGQSPAPAGSANPTTDSNQDELDQLLAELEALSPIDRQSTATHELPRESVAADKSKSLGVDVDLPMEDQVAPPPSTPFSGARLEGPKHVTHPSMLPRQEVRIDIEDDTVSVADLAAAQSPSASIKEKYGLQNERQPSTLGYYVDKGLETAAYIAGGLATGYLGTYALDALGAFGAAGGIL